jgi:hypothetical protein
VDQRGDEAALPIKSKFFTRHNEIRALPRELRVPVFGVLVIAPDPGNDEGYPVHVHIRTALEARPGSLKRPLRFNHNDPPRAQDGVLFNSGQTGGMRRTNMDRAGQFDAA